MSYSPAPLFPTNLPVGFSVKRKPVTSTIVARHVSGRTVRRANYVYPLFSWELTYEALHDGAGLGGIGANSFQALQGFFADRLGQAGLFSYQDALDNQMTAEPLGIGDGTTTIFPLVWTLGSNALPVGQVNPAGISFTIAGSAVSGSTWGITNSGNAVQFNSAPASGQIVAGTYQYFHLCAFDEDSIDFEQFMAHLWSARSVKFTSVKQ